MRLLPPAVVLVAALVTLAAAPGAVSEGEEDLLRCMPIVAGDVSVAEVCPPWEALSNGGFELCDDCEPDAGDLPRNWSYVPYAWARQSGASWTQRTSYDGGSALDLTCGATPTTTVLSDHMRVDVGETLTWSVHVQGPADGVDSGTYALATVELFTPDGGPAGGGGGYGSYTDGAWERYESTLTVPDGVGGVALQLECGSDAAEVAVAFDDASVRRT